MKNKKLLHILLAVIACLLWSTAFSSIKRGYNFMDDRYAFAGLRFTLAGVLLIPFSWRKRSLKEFKKNFKFILEVAFLQTFLTYALFYYALSLVDAATTAVIIGSGPIMVALMSNYMVKNDKMNIKKIFSLLIGMLGVITIFINPELMSGEWNKRVIGIIILFINVLIGAFITIRVGKKHGTVNPIFLASNHMLLGGVLLLILSRIVEGSVNFILPSEFYIILLWLAFVSATAFSLWFYILQSGILTISEVSMWKFIIPTFGAIFSWVLLKNEAPDVWSVVGIVEIMFSFIFYYGYERVSKKVIEKYRKKCEVKR